MQPPHSTAVHPSVASRSARLRRPTSPLNKKTSAHAPAKAALRSCPQLATAVAQPLAAAQPAQSAARLPPVPSPPVPSTPLAARPSRPAPAAVATETKAALRDSSQVRKQLGELTDQEQEAWEGRHAGRDGVRATTAYRAARHKPAATGEAALAHSGRQRSTRLRSLRLAAAADFGLPPRPRRRQQQQHHHLQWTSATASSPVSLWAAGGHGHGPCSRRHER